MKQGEIWLISLDPTIGAEIKKTRPAIIVNNNVLGKLPLKIIIPLTDWKEHYAVAAWMIKVVPDMNNKLPKESAADCFQIRSLSEERCIKKIGDINIETLINIQKAVVKILSIN